MPIISVIIPVYNVEKYLSRCLRSVLNQTLLNIEIICVNDGSTDGSLNILQKYAQMDRRIIVLDQENQGQGVARNNAMKIAKGEYIAFVDSDDWLDSNMLEILYGTAKSNDANVVQCSYRTHSPTSGVYVIDRMKDCFPNEDISNKFVRIPKSEMFQASWAPWYRIYKTEFLKENNIEFSALKYGEDVPFSLAVKLLSPIFYVDKPLCNYRIRKNSSRTYDVEYDKIIDSVTDVLKRLGLLKEYQAQLDEYVAYMYYLKQIRLYPRAHFKFLAEHLPRLNFSQFVQLSKNIFIEPNQHLMYIKKREL